MTTKQAMVLLPCPFCGGEAVMEEIQHGVDGVRFSVGCCSDYEATCMGYQSITSFARRGDAAAAWNTRPAPVVGAGVRAQTIDLRRLFADHYWDSFQDDKELVLKHIDAVLALHEVGEAR